MPEAIETPASPLLEAITDQLQSLSAEELHTLQEFVGYLLWKRQSGTDAVADPKPSAEARAIARIKDLDDPTQWVTVIDEGEEVDEEALNQWLKARGYQD